MTSCDFTSFYYFLTQANVNFLDVLGKEYYSLSMPNYDLFQCYGLHEHSLAIYSQKVFGHLDFPFLTLNVPENLKLYGLYVYYVVHINFATLAC